MVDNYYAILRVAPNASQQDVDLAYRRQVEKYHPTLATDTSGYARLQDLNKAWRVLSDPFQRRRYDRVLRKTRGRFLHGGNGTGVIADHPARRSGSDPFDSVSQPFEIVDRPVHRIPTPLLALGALFFLLSNVAGLVGLVTFLDLPHLVTAALAPRVSEAPTAVPTAPATRTPISIVIVERPCVNGCTTPIAGCDIKGDATAQGQRIYYLPADPIYGEIQIEPDAGERWFCREMDAVASGWVRATDVSLPTATQAAPTQPAPTDNAAAKSKALPTEAASETATPTLTVRLDGTHPYAAPVLESPSSGAEYRCGQPLTLRWTEPGNPTLGPDEWYVVEAQPADRSGWFPMSEWVKETFTTRYPAQRAGGCDAFWWPHPGVFEWRVAIVAGDAGTHRVRQRLSPPSKTFLITYDP